MTRVGNTLAILAGPINDTGQLALAVVIDALVREDGWAVHTRQDLAKATRTKCLKTNRQRINTMINQGWLEERKKPVPGLRLTEKALNRDWGKSPPDWEESPLDWEKTPPGPGGGNSHQTGAQTHQSGDISHPPSLTAYLPLKDIDTKEEEKEEEIIRGVPERGGDPDTRDRPDQPAAQPPAATEWSESLPAKPKAKRKRKLPENPVTRIPENWEPDGAQLDNLEARHGIPRAFVEALVWEFRTYWTDRGASKHSWPSTFTNHAKSQWKREQEHEQNAEQRQRYTDASGRPISEGQYVARQVTKRVLADMESGVLADVDLDTKF